MINEKKSTPDWFIDDVVRKEKESGERISQGEKIPKSKLC
jgi:hypothetical protein